MRIYNTNWLEGLPVIELQLNPISGILEPEIWKDLEGYQHPCKVSNYGRVVTFTYNNVVHLVKSTPDSNGYLQITVRLPSGFKRATRKVHKLVELLFMPKPENGDLVDHKNNDKSNNCVINLQHVSCRVNSLKDRKGIYSIYPGVTYCKMYNKWISQIRVGTKKISKRFNSEVEAFEFYRKTFEEITGKSFPVLNKLQTHELSN